MGSGFGLCFEALGHLTLGFEIGVRARGFEYVTVECYKEP